MLSLSSQNFIADSIPELGPGVTEAARLHSALFGAYECVVMQERPLQFSGVILYDQSPGSWQKDGPAQFSVKEEEGDTECTLTLKSQRDDFSLWLMELVPLDSNLQPVEFRVGEKGARRRVIRYRRDQRPYAVKLRVVGVNAVDIGTVTVSLWSGDMPVAHFARPVICAADHGGPFNIDLLDNPGAKQRPFDEQMRTLFHNIFHDKLASERALEIQCSYRNRIIRGDTRAYLPVLLSRVERSDQTLPLALSSSIKAWYRNTSPRSGSFVFALTFFATVDDRPQPALKLRELLLPNAAVTDMQK